MKCILLCAGYATRLFPLTENFPKSLLKVGGRAILDYTLDEVNSIDEIDEIYLVTNEKYTPHFQKWVEEKKNCKRITVYNDGTSSNDDRLGAIGDLHFTIEKANIQEDMLVLATDNLFTFRLGDFIDYYKKVNSPCICVKEEKDYELLKRLGVAQLDEDMKLIGFEEKPANPKSRYAVYAQYIYPKEVLPCIEQYLQEGNSSDAPGNLVAYLHKKLPTYAFAFEGECFDVGTHEALAEADKRYSK